MAKWLILYRRYKFLPLTFGATVLALILRIEVAHEHARAGLFVTTAYVVADDAKTSSSDAKTPDSDAKKTNPDVKPDAKPADGKATDKPADTKPAPPADPLDTQSQEGRPSGELTILRDLADRRTALEKREAALNDREALLQASQKQFDEKLKQLTDLRNEIKQLLDAANAKQDDETKRLVDVYEKMKPKEAADIFSNMGIDVLLPIAQGMKEAKLSPILASMPPDRARQLTAILYQKSKILPQVEPAAAAANAVTAPTATSPAKPAAPAPDSAMTTKPEVKQ